MKYANKLMMVPYTKILDDPEQAKMVELDTNMSSILADKNLQLDEKIKLYNQTLAKYMSQFKSESFPKPEVLNEISEQIANVVDNNSKLQNEIEFIKELIQNKVKQEPAQTIQFEPFIKYEKKVPKIKDRNINKSKIKQSTALAAQVLKNIQSVENANVSKSGRNSRYTDPNESGVATRGMLNNMALIEPDSIMDATTGPILPPNLNVTGNRKQLPVLQSTNIFSNRINPIVNQPQYTHSNDKSQTMNLQMDTTMENIGDDTLNTSQFYDAANQSIHQANLSLYQKYPKIVQTPTNWINDRVNKIK
jgi:hypothetical protein